MITINVEKFIRENYTEYLGDGSFLAPISQRNQQLWNKCKKLLQKEKEKGGVLDIDTKHFSGINNFKPGYIDKDLELIVGLQTDKPLKRIVNPYGGKRMVEKSLKAYGYKLSKEKQQDFDNLQKTHNEGVFDAYTDAIKKARHNHLITGLPDAYGRGRIIGDYRRVALYGIDTLIEQKKEDLKNSNPFDMTETFIRLREEVSMQIKALKEMKEMALSYGIDISKPAVSAQEAIQAIYFAYLAGAKENNGAATSLGRVSTFIDIYIERDIRLGILNEIQAQELIDQFIMKLRLIRHLRTPEYNELFAGDPTWITESIGGIGPDGRSLVTKTSYRFLQSLINLGPAPEPNMTILWDERLPQNFKDFCAEISIKTNAIQYENDKLMKEVYGEDYGVACCVSGMQLGKEMQFFGARCNLAKALLYAINEGKDEITGELVVPNIPPLSEGVLKIEEVSDNFLEVLNYVVHTYVAANNIIHYMHDKYAYEASQMALHDTSVKRLMAFGIAGFSVVIDSLSAITYAKVTPIRDERGIAFDFQIENDYPKYGNDIPEVDNIGNVVVREFITRIRDYELYRQAKPTLSILTITSNVVYGKHTGATPDGRKKGEPFAPGANPMHERDSNGALASLNSVASILYKKHCEDGISNTFSIIPSALGKNRGEQIKSLSTILDGYFKTEGHHLNINVLDREMLLDALVHPENYTSLTIRVSGYAVLFNSLTKEQKYEVINRTIHDGGL